MIDGIKMFISFIGGLALFIYGMEVMSTGFQKAAGEKMSFLLGKATSSKLLAVLVGATATAIVQSSSATTVMVVGFVNAGVMSLTQTVGIIMGANIGTTVTSWIISASEWTVFLKPTTIAPLAVALGVGYKFTTKDQTRRIICDIFIGFGILFVGMSTMSSAMKPLRDSPQIISMFQTFGTKPLLGVLAGVIVTFLVQSSSASVGILQSMALQGLVPYSAAVYIIMGQNIGTCFTALISSIGASKNAKAASYVHLLFNVIGSAVFTIIAIIYFKTFGSGIALLIIPATTISIIHTVFNLANTAMLYPFSNQIVFLAKKMAKIDDEEEVKAKENEALSVVKLDERLLETPTIAFDMIEEEVLKVGHLSENIVHYAGKTITESKDKYSHLVSKCEENINTNHEKLISFITEAIQRKITGREREICTNYLYVLNNLERVGDHAVNIAESYKYLDKYETKFSDEAIDEINNLLNRTIECLNVSLLSFKDSSVIAATNTCQIENDIDKIVDKLRKEHVDRLTNNTCTPQAGIVYWDLLSNFERISDHARNIAELQIKE